MGAVAQPQSKSETISQQSSSFPRGLTILTIITVLGTILGLYLGLVFVGPDADQGNVQRIFYYHMPSFFGAFFAFGATVIGGVQYLRTRKTKWDTLALAGVEVGLALGLVNLVTGMVWARPIWNTWWTWDPRLTSAAVMVLTYAAYLMLRAGIENPDTRRRFASVYGIVAIVTVILTLVIIRIVPQTIHPTVVGPSPTSAEGGFKTDDAMAVVLVVNIFVWGVLIPWTLMWFRIRLQNRMEQIEEAKLKMLGS